MTKIQPKVTFVTGNKNKAQHMTELLGLEINYQALDVDEIQSADPEEVVSRKAKQAYELLGSPVFVDDFSLGIDALDNLPGPFIKFFVEAKGGLNNLCRMVDGLKSRAATARGHIAYCDADGVVIFSRQLKGRIADSPRGEADYAFGADPIFEVDGYHGRTRAELSKEEYDAVYLTVRPIAELRSFLQKKVGA